MPDSSNSISRRDLLKVSGAVGVAALGAPFALASPATTSSSVAKRLEKYVVPRDTVDRFLDPNARVWARYHPTYGYLLRDSFVRDGVDGARTIGRYEPAGHRRQINFRDAPCRIHTYGDSFTQGHQVSDGETWQEVLAAHFCEPIRNFGVGGFGVYQAYRRMVEIESSDAGVDHLVLNIWGDDHHRSVYAWRWLSFPVEFLPNLFGVMFHANPWTHARLDPSGETIQEQPNACPTPESLYQLCDADWIVDGFASDPITHALFAHQTGHVADHNPIEQLIAESDFADLDLGTSESTRSTTENLINAYAVRVGARVVVAANEFAKKHGKRLFVLLSHPAGSVWRHCAGKSAAASGECDWHPQSFRDHLTEAGIPFVDTVQKHLADFAKFKGSAKEYVDRYYIGHYSPTGNHFFAYAVKDELAGWLSPPPPAYANAGQETLIRFEGYLPE